MTIKISHVRGHEVAVMIADDGERSEPAAQPVDEPPCIGDGAGGVPAVIDQVAGKANNIQFRRGDAFQKDVVCAGPSCREMKVAEVQDLQTDQWFGNWKLDRFPK